MNTRTMLEVLTRLKKEAEQRRAPVIELMQSRGDSSPFRILIGTILSARTNDRTTSQVVERLFTHVKGFRDLERIPKKELEELIYPVGFYRNKAAHLKKLVHKVRELGDIPRTMDGLLQLPGVGRKTANLVLSAAFDIPAVCVDTHVHRIVNRLGYAETNGPHETEKALRTHVPKDYWQMLNYVLVSHGQSTCTPQKPRCSDCVLSDICERRGVSSSA